jgi:hypothetical protein
MISTAKQQWAVAMLSTANQQWAVAMLTAAADRNPLIHEDGNPQAACFLAGLAATWLREVALSHNCCVHHLLRELGLGVAQGEER